jgi:carbon monoxide dehydrogenase subunit G
VYGYAACCPKSLLPKKRISKPKEINMAIHIEASEEIAAPVEDVFNYTMEPANLAEWQSELVEAYGDGPISVGSVTTEVRKIAGIKVKSQVQCTEYNPPYRAAFQVLKGPVPFNVVQTYEGVNGSTRLTVSIEGEVAGPLKVLGEGKVASQTEKELVADLAALKAIFGG